MTSDPKDRYLAALEDKRIALSSRDSALKREEGEHAARGEEIRIRREQFEAERQAHAAALSNYMEFLKSQPQDVQAEEGEQGGDEWSATRLRMGDSRKSVLLYIARITRKEPGQSTKLTVRAIAEGADVPSERVSNVVWKDIERGYLVRNGDVIRMTDLGFELLKRAGALNDIA